MDRDGLAAILAAALRGPKLPDAACYGEPVLHDPRELREPAEDLAYRHDAARRVCAACPSLAACREWLTGLPPQDRPVGTITAGVLVEEAPESEVAALSA